MKMPLLISMMLFYSAHVYSLELYARPAKQRYLPGEGVEIILTVENNSPMRMAVPLKFSIQCPGSHLTFGLTGEERSLVHTVSCKIIRIISDASILWLYPGGKYTTVVRLSVSPYPPASGEPPATEEDLPSAEEIEASFLYPRFQVRDQHGARGWLEEGQHSLYALYDITAEKIECPVCEKYPSFRKELWHGSIQSESFTIHIGN